MSFASTIARRSRRGVAVLTAVLLVGTGWAQPVHAEHRDPAPTTGDSTPYDVLWSASNLLIEDPAHPSQSTLSDLADSRCPAPVRLQVATPTAREARDLAKAALASVSTKWARRAFHASSAYRDPGALRQGMVVATVSNRQGGALATVIRLSELEPRAQRHWVNLASLLLGFGKLKAAAAAISVAQALPDAPPLDGIPGSALLDTVRGELELAAGHFDAAADRFLKASEASPLLPAARKGEANALKCQGKDALALGWMMRGERLYDYVATSGPTPTDPDPLPVQPWTETDVQDSGVGLGEFGKLIHPGTPEDAVAHEAEFKQAADAAAARAFEYDEEGRAALRRALTVPGAVVPLSFFNYVLRSTEDPLSPGYRLLQNARASAAALNTAAHYLPGGQSGACHAVEHHSQFWGALHQALDVKATEADYLHRAYTSMTTLTNNPDIVTYFNRAADATVALIYESVVELAWSYTTFEKRELPLTECAPYTGGGGQATGTTSRENSAPDGGACDKGKQAFRLKIKLGDYLVTELNCDSGKVEVVPAKWGPSALYLGVFGEVSAQWKTGDVTAMIGTKAGIGVKIPGLPDLSGSGKVGIYVKAGPQILRPGQLPEYGTTPGKWVIKDLGIRVQGNADVQLAQWSEATALVKWGGKIDVSLLGIFSP